MAYWMFQVVFAATAATIVSGAVTERTKFSVYLIYSAVISAFIYPVVGHWIWGGGWLSKLGMIDFAGSTVVHSVGGWAGLVGAFLLGPRLGKYSENSGKKISKAIPGHSIPLATLGCFILWFGWFGFNPGSTTSGTNLAIATCGVFGTLSVGFFAEENHAISSGVGKINGLFFGGGFHLLGIQALGAVSVFLWVTVSSLIMFGILKKLIGLRVSRDEEIRGLDIGEHGMDAYAGFQVFTIQ